MNVTLKGRFARVASVALGFTMLLALATPVAAQTTSIDALLAQIASLQAQLVALQGGTSPTIGSCSFTANLSMGANSSEVKMLQQFLNSHGAVVSTSGAGAPGSESMYFGAKTKAAVIKWQDMNVASVLTPVGLSKGSGFWGSFSRAYANSLCTLTGPVTPTIPGVPAPVGGSAAITAGTQPAGSLAPHDAARIPFTKFTVTTGSADVTVNSVEVMRTGLADDAIFSGVVLLDGSGQQVGIAKTLNSLHRATVGEPVVVKAGTSMTFTIAGNMASALTNYAGQVATLSVVGVNTNGTVSGSFPIVGAAHTVNQSLTIGSLTMGTSGLVDTAATIDIGQKNVFLSGVRATAGSSEDVRLWSLRWNQAGSAAPSDLTNIMVKVGDTSYPTVVSSDGKYYTAAFGVGIVVPKGNTVEITISGEPVGGPNRTIAFDIYKTTDLYATGELFGYGITPPVGSATAAATSQEFTAGTPWYSSITKTINAGNVTTVSKSSAVPAQNIAENLSEQPLGGFEIDVKGEPISVQSLVFQFLIANSGGQVDDIDNVTLTNLTTGQIVAGPKDAATAAAYGTVTFTDTVTFPIGKNTYVLKGKLNTDFNSDQTIIASTTPSSNWTNVTGQITGNSITLSNGVVTMNTMTVKVATATITMNSQPATQNVVVGKTGFVFAKINIDATASGENIRLNSMELDNSTPTGTSVPTNCFAYSSTGTRLNSTALNPADGTEGSFSFSSALVIKKGSIEVLDIKCDVPSNLTNNDSFRFIHTAGTNVFSGTGETSGQSVSFGQTTGNGNTMTFRTAGTWTVVADSSTPNYMIVAAGQSNVVSGILKFHATNEDIIIKKLNLQNTNTASSTNETVIGVSLWDGNTKVGSGIFTGGLATTTGTNASTTITLDQTYMVPKDTDKILTVKVNLASIGTSLSGVEGALVAIDYDGQAVAGESQGTGSESGTTINSGSTSDTAFGGVRVFKSYPTFAKLSLPSSTLVTGTTMDLYRFSVKANSSGPVGIYKFTVNIATSSTPTGTSSTTVTNLKVSAYTNDNFSSTVSGFSPDGQLNDTTAGLVSSGNTDVLMTASTQGQDYLQIPTNTTYYFKVVGDITMTGSPTGATVVTNLQGDAAYPAIATLMGTSGAIDAGGSTNDDFIWSPNATTTSETANQDWTNGYNVAGLPSVNMDQSTLSK